MSLAFTTTGTGDLVAPERFLSPTFRATRPKAVRR
jgi:hypothetical protein